MRGLPWYIVLALSAATWAVVLGVVLVARRFRPPPPEPGPAGEVLADDDEPVLTGVAIPGLAAEFTTEARPYANGVLHVGEDPGGHVSLKGESEATEGEH